METMLGAKRPLAQQEVLERVSDQGLHRVSVYRALQAFVDSGIVHRVDAGDRLWRFALCECGHSSHCHPHFTCRVCGRVECLNEVDLPRLERPPPGYKVEEQEIYIRGVCPGCTGDE